MRLHCVLAEWNNKYIKQKLTLIFTKRHFVTSTLKNQLREILPEIKWILDDVDVDDGNYIALV